MAITPNYSLPLPADSAYVADTALIIRDAHTTVDTVLKQQETDVTTAKQAAIDASKLVGAPAGEAVRTAISEGGAARSELSAAIDHKVETGAITRARTDALRADGDSLTSGGSTEADSWALKLGQSTGMEVYRNGSPGECSGGIAIKGGAIRAKLILPGNAVPGGSGTITGTFTTDVTPCNIRLGVFSATGALVGTNGQVPGTFAVPESGVATFTYTGLATPITLPEGGANFIVDGTGSHLTATQVIWLGRNDVAFAWPNHATGTVAAAQALIDQSTVSVKRVIIPSLISGTNEGASTGAGGSRGRVLEVNAAKKAAFPSFYYDVRRDFIDKGLAMAGIVPTTDDLASIADDTVPPSLMSDTIHPNNAGRMVISALFEAEFERRGGIGTEPIAALTPAEALGVGRLIDSHVRLYAAEKYYTANFASKASAPLPVGTLRMAPFVVDRPMTLKGTSSQFGIRVQTAVASSTLRVGIYRSDSNGLPAGIVLDGGTVDTSTTTGTKWCNTAPVALSPGLYWLGALALGGAPSITQGGGSVVPIGYANAASLIESVFAGYQVTGLADLPTTVIDPSPAPSAPVIAVILQNS